MFFECDTEFNHYSVADTTYNGRPARVLYSGAKDAAQSGMATDDEADLLFDYNQRFFELLQGLKPKRVLVLGGGAFTLPTALIQEFPELKLDVVELDGGLVDIAKKYFDFRPNEYTTVHIGDGRRFIDETDQKYDAVVIDVYTHATIPRSFQTLEAAQSLNKCIVKNGIVAINIIASREGARSMVLHRMQEIMQANFRNVQIFPAGREQSSWNPQNYVMTAQDNIQNIAQYLRYPSVELPSI